MNARASFNLRPRIAVLMAASVIGASPGVATLAAQRQLSVVRSTVIDGNVNDLSAIRYAAVSARGTIAIAQPQDHLIRFFDAAGKPIGSFGREGDGPGEFRQMFGGIGWTGDTLWVLEIQRKRLTYVGPDLKLLRSDRTISSMEPPAGTVGERGLFKSVDVHGVNPDGTLILSILADTSVSPPAWLRTSPKEVKNAAGFFFARATVTGRFLSLIGFFPPSVAMNACMRSVDRSRIPVPFCAQPLFAVGPTGNGLGSVFPGNTGSEGYRFVLTSGLNGDTLAARSVKYQPVPIPGRISDSVRQVFLARNDLPAGLKTAYSQMAFPATFPPIRTLIIGSDNSMWIEEYQASTASHRWRVFDAKGSDVGYASLPATASIILATRTNLWAVVTDDRGLESLIQYQIR